MKQAFLYFYLLLLGLTACSPYTELERVAEEINRYFPTEDFYQSLSQSDTVIYYSPEQIKNDQQTIDRFLLRLSTIQPGDSWKPEKKVLHQELENYLQTLKAYFTQFQKDPSIYNLGGKIQQQLTSETLDTQQKTASIQKNLGMATRYYRHAQACLEQPDPDRLRLAIQKQRKGLQLLETSLVDSLRSWDLSKAQLGAINRKKYVAVLSCKDFIAYCNSLLFEEQEQKIQTTSQ